jgi:hypothetical protein
MMKRNGLLVLFLILTVAISACGGGGGGGETTVTVPVPGPAWQEGTLITSPTVSPIVSFTQNVKSDGTSSYYEVFPNQANVWSLDTDMALVDGFGNQFRWALLLTVDTGTTAQTFPSDQAYSDLSFYTPYMGAADGVTVAAVSNGKSTGLASLVTGSYSAFLNATSDSRLQQRIDLTSLPANTPLSLSWNDAVSLDFGAINVDPGYRVVIQDLSGNLTTTVLTPITSATLTTRAYTGVLDQYAGHQILLSFELHSAISPFQEGPNSVPPFSSTSYAIIDDVSIRAHLGSVLVANGNFETGGLAPWSTNTPREVQNVTSGSRNVNGLDVKRSFYTVPNKLWGRWVDVFSNNTATTITRTVVYDTSLGSNGTGIIYPTPGTIVSSGTNTVSKALTSYDFVTGNRDIGWVFGNAKSVTFNSYIYDPVAPTVGSDLITVTYDITVPAHGKVALVNFIIMDGSVTGSLGNPNAKATAIDAAAAAIVSNFWTDVQYRNGMTQAQVVAIQNLSN